MERLKNRIWKRGSGSQSQEQESMDTTTTNGERDSPESSYLNLTPHSTLFSSFRPSHSTSAEPLGAAAPIDTNLSTSQVDLLTQQVDLLTDENARLQNNVIDLTDELNSVKECQLSLISKTEDLTHSLDLEKRRFQWQKNFYEKKILDLALSRGSNDVISGSPDVDGINAMVESMSNAFYQQTIAELVAEQENKESQLAEIKSNFEKEIKQLKESHEAAIAELLESNHSQVKQLVGAHEELIKDLLSGCEGLFDEMKVEFLRDAETNTELKTTSGKKIWKQFQDLPTEKKGVIVIGVCIVTVATAGWASWGFIIWVWPRLLIFAESVAANPEILARWMSVIIGILNSTQFQNFVKAWESGQPIGTCLKPFLNTDLLASALQMAPNLFKQLKNKRGCTIVAN